MKTNELTGAALDWAVAKCEGTLGKKPKTCSGCKHHEERAITDSSEHFCHHPDSMLLMWTGTCSGYVDDTPFGDGISVDYGTHQSCPITEHTAEKYSTDWSQGGPIIEREKIRLDCPWPDSWNAQHKHSAKIDGVIGWMTGDTPLIAAMRCYVASKMGDEVEVPNELTQGEAE